MDSFGLERSIEPRHALAQQAWKIDNTMTLRSDEVLIDVKIININLASFNEILDETGEDRALLCQRVLEIVRERGKLHNPVTNSGGMLYGTVVELGPSYPNIYHIRPKDEIISLSSLTVTPLHITQILRIDCESAQLEVEGQAILYANSPVVKKPPDLPLRAVIAAMDEAGAPTRSYQIVQPGQDVLILGASGRIGLMCGYAAKDKMGSSGRLVGIVRDQESRIQMEPCSVFDEVLELDATNLSALCGTPHAEIIQRFDVVINCINTADTEAASLLAVKNHGTIYFATICCDYKFVALTAESIGKEIQVIPYTGFLEGHADYTLGLMRRFPQMQTDIQRGICGVPETISIPNSDETPHAKSEADEDCASGYIFHSLEAKATLRQALKVARYTSNVMIYGESGVGKEIIARIIHQNSERKSFPMVKINCAAIPEHLLESELFGYHARFGDNGMRELLGKQRAVLEGLAIRKLNPEDVVEQLAALAEDHGTSLRTLYRWMDAYEAKGLPGIMRAVSRKDKGTRPSICAAAYQYAYGLYADKVKRTQATIYNKLVDKAAVLGPDACQKCIFCEGTEARARLMETGEINHYPPCAEPVKAGMRVPECRQTLSRMLAAIPSDEVTLARRGVKAWKDDHMFMALREKPQRVNEVWFGDHHQFDCFVLDETGKPVRPWLTAWYDAATGCLVGWVLCTNPNTETITEAFIRGVAHTEHSPFYGLPAHLYICDAGGDVAQPRPSDLQGRGGVQQFVDHQPETDPHP